MQSKKFWLAATALVGILVAAPASAVEYRFDVFDPTVTQSGAPLDGNTYTFYFDGMPLPADFDATSFTLTGSAYYSAGVFGSYRADGPFTFYNDAFGGLSTPLGLYFGDVLFDGPSNAPTFKLGTFALDVGSITISTATVVSPMVPEPASWAMMISGFGMVGGALRYRQRRVGITFG